MTRDSFKQSEKEPAPPSPPQSCLSVAETLPPTPSPELLQGRQVTQPSLKGGPRAFNEWDCF